MVILNDLMNIMDEINKIYLKLYRLELLGELNSNYFFELVKELKISLIREEELFNQFIKTPEYLCIKDDILKESRPLFARMKDYIMIYDTVNMELNTKEESELAPKLRELYLVGAKNIYLIYLSLLQEFIETVDEVKLKEKLLSLKYYVAFTKLVIGKLLITNDFQISRESYVNYLVIDMVKIDDYNSYEIMLDSYMCVIIEMLKQLFSFEDEQYKDLNVVVTSKGIEFMIRAAFALLSDNDYELKKDDIFVAIYELSNDKNLKAGDIIDSIIESRTIDRCRVRKISLRPLDD